MALNIISNFAASVAHRNLTKTDMEVTGSLSKLSSGTRVLSAKDDAASLAIGSRLNAEVQAMKQASVNASQAVSMLQIADGAMAKTDDILVRMKSLSVQAGSGNLSSTERSLIDNEYQALLLEVDRIAQDTEFNGTALVNGSSTTSTARSSLSGSVVEAADGFASIAFNDSVGNAEFTVSFNATTNVLTINNLTSGQSEGVDIGATAITGNNTQTVNFSNLGATVVLNSAFDKTADLTIANTVSALSNGGDIDSVTVTGGSDLLFITDAAGTLTSGATTGAVLITFDVGTDSATGSFANTTGAQTMTIANGTNNVTVSLTLETAFTSDGAGGTITLDALNHAVQGAVSTSNTTTFSFKVGSGTSAQDDISVSVGAISVSSLGLTGTDVTDAANADSASGLITTAIDTLNTRRSQVGAAQNRMEFASANISVAIENMEASRSGLLDLDIASEMSRFTSKQILLQAGVAMLGQANRMPQNLLALLQ
ncbi:MAG: flagellin [Alphaproteobacteria bacterium]